MTMNMSQLSDEISLSNKHTGSVDSGKSISPPLSNCATEKQVYPERHEDEEEEEVREVKSVYKIINDH